MAHRSQHNHSIHSWMDRLGLGNPESDLPEMHQRSLFTKAMNKVVHEVEAPEQTGEPMTNGVRVFRPGEMPPIRSQHEMTRSIGAVPMRVVDLESPPSNDSGETN